MPRSTIADAPLATALTLTSVDTQAPTRRRLAELGLRPGAHVTVLRRTAGGGRIVSVADSRIALDAATAALLVIDPAEAAA